MAKLNAIAVAAVAIEIAGSMLKDGQKMADTIRAFLAGTPATKREDKMKEVYAAIRTIDGKQVAVRELPEVNKKAYDAAAQAYRREYVKPQTATGKGRKGRAGKVETVKVTGTSKEEMKAIAANPKRLAGMLKIIVATLQAQETPKFKDQPALIASIQVAISKAV